MQRLTAPYQGVAGTHDRRRVYRIRVNDAQNEPGQRVATETVDEQLVIDARIGITLTVPRGRCTFGDTTLRDSGVRLHHVQRQHHNGVVMTQVNRITIDTRLGNHLAAERFAVASTDVLLHMFLHRRVNVFRHFYPMDTVASVDGLVTAFVRTGLSNRHAAPRNALADFQLLELSLLKTRVHVHYEPIDAVHRRVHHRNSVGPDSVFVHYYLTVRIDHRDFDSVTRTDFVVLGLNYAVGGLSPYCCRDCQNEAAQHS